MFSWPSAGGTATGFCAGAALALGADEGTLGANLHLPGMRVCSQSPPCLHLGHAQ